ncbi:threonine ammonia-lyase [Pantoea vagans]|uniref:threonine ammonia-lyase n=1 Tax=Pantoea vagans TaxID=470934 RepID=UPI0030179CBB
MTEQALPTAVGITAAVASIDPVFLNSPLLMTNTANDSLGCQLYAKVETLNPIRCFKGRGAGWWMANLPEDDMPIVSASAGNFGQGLAHAAARKGRRLIIYAATSANPLKISAMRRLGAEVVQTGGDFDAAKLAAQTFAEENGFLFAEDGAECHIAEGAGTIAKEITESLKSSQPLQALFVPLGNGALLTGTATWMRERMPECRVIGVVAEAAPAMKLSWEQNTIVTTTTAPTMADGIAVRVPVPYALQSMRGIVDEVVAVEESAIEQAMHFCLINYGVVVEPSGAVGIAALLRDPQRWKGHSVATILCGGNVVPQSA